MNEKTQNTPEKGKEISSITDASAGTNADTKASVEIGQVYGGYFSNPLTAQQFCTLGIDTILKDLPLTVRYADFGGGDGYLSKFVAEYLATHGKKASSLVVDANADYLKKAADERGLNIKCADLRSVDLGDNGADLITMRAVNHYSAPVDQIALLYNTYKNLNEGGVLISQVSSGSYENCDLRSKIVNVPSLDRAGSGMNYYWTSAKEYMSMLTLTGFKDVQLVGYADNNFWTPEDQWERFHSKETIKAESAGDTVALGNLSAQKEKFLHTAYALIEIYEKEYGESIDIEHQEDGTVQVYYKYPVIVARK